MTLAPDAFGMQNDLPWIDTHCHLDAPEFADDRGAVIAEFEAKGLANVVLPAVNVGNFGAVAHLAHSFPAGRYALGIHPMCSPGASQHDLELLDLALAAAMDDPRLVAVGEIGIDLFIESLKSDEAREHQEWLFKEQLRLARKYDLPVLVHIRRAQDRVLKVLREVSGVKGIAHAFNGSHQQAEAFVALGFKLGIGGAMTFTRALNIRRIAQRMPLSALVLETDSPDISPAWRHPQRNVPAEIPAIGQVLAELRGLPLAELAHHTAANARAVLPRL